MAGLTFRKRKKRINYQLIKEGVVWVGELVLTFVIACLLVVNFGVMTSNVGQSMEPTLASGDKVLTNRLIYKLTAPKRGDLVIFKPNGNENSHFYIKRIIGLPGETISFIGWRSVRCHGSRPSIRPVCRRECRKKFSFSA